MCDAYGRGMIPPLSTRKLQSTIEAQRRSDADLRWEQAFGAARLTLPTHRPGAPESRR